MTKDRKGTSPYRAPHKGEYVDGVNHINIWHTGATELGRQLSHTTETPFIHPYFGPFNSIEGFWYYIRSETKDDKLRMMFGQEAKNYGRKLTHIWVDGFPSIIMAANFHKIDQRPELKKMFVESTLPFDHYYLFGPGKVLVRPKVHGWLVGGFENLRRLMKEGKTPREPHYDDLAKRR